MPVVGCDCAVCTSPNPKNSRLRSSCLFEIDDKFILIDTTPDLRQQALNHRIHRLDGVLYTHVHADHVHGLDELRVYNAYQNAAVDVYGNQETIDHLIKNFSYIFRPPTSYPSLVPRLEPHVVSGRFDCAGISVQMIPCFHGPKYQTMNYRIGNVAWLTDISGIPDDSYPLLKNLDVLFIDGLRLKPHPTHLHLEAALMEARKIGAKKTFFIHLTHDYDHDVFNQTLESGFELAYDGLVVEV